MTAEEMFEKLGYTLTSLLIDLPKYENGDWWIEFKKDKTVTIGNWNEMLGETTWINVDFELINAIQKQIEELGW